jgi:hypothetical protein
MSVLTCVRASSYSKVGAVEQREMVNSGVRGTMDRNLGLRTEVGCKVLLRASHLQSTLSCLSA